MASETSLRTSSRLTSPKPYTRWNFYLLWVCLILLLAVSTTVGLWATGVVGPSRQWHSENVPSEHTRQLATKLLSVGLVPQAIRQYEQYFQNEHIPPATKADIAYTLGKLCADQGRYEEALTWLYQVEMLDPETPHKDEIGPKIVSCLERLGKFSAAQYTLDARSSTDKDHEEAFKGSTPVAKIGKDVITLEEVDRALDALPEWMRNTFRQPGKKEEFLKQYVAEELLYRKARRLEYDKDAQVRQQAELALRQMMIQKVLEKEVKDKVTVRDDDVSLYYKAHQDRYKEKEGVRVRLIKVPEADGKNVEKELKQGAAFSDIAQRLSTDEHTKGKGGEFAGWVEKGSDPFGIGDPDTLWKALDNCNKNDVTPAIKAGADVYFFSVLERRPERQLPFDEVKDRVHRDLYQERMEKAYQELIQGALQGSEVQLFPENMQKAAK